MLPVIKAVAAVFLFLSDVISRSLCGKNVLSHNKDDDEFDRTGLVNNRHFDGNVQPVMKPFYFT